MNKNIFILIAAITFIFYIFPNGYVHAENAKPNQGIYKNLIVGYQDAHKSKNAKKLKKLFCLDRVPEKLFSKILNHLEKGFNRTLKKVSVTEIDKDWPMAYEMNGITYSPNLKPEAQLLIQFVKGSGTKHTKLLIGEKDGIKVLIILVPEAK